MENITNIKKVKFRIETDRMALIESNGKVDQVDNPDPDPKTGLFEFNDRGPYSERIFGRSSSSKDSIYKTINNDRNVKKGHIEVMPYILPLLRNRGSNVIAKLLGSKAKQIEGLLNLSLTLVVIKKDSELLQDGQGKLISEALEKGNILKPMTIINTKITENPYLYYLIDSARIVDKPTNRSLRLDSKFTDEVLKEVLNKNRYIEATDASIVTGPPAIAHLLAQSTLEEDYLTISKFLEAVKAKDNFKVGTTAWNDAKQFTNYLQTIRGLIDQGLTKRDLVREIVTVIPAGLRDRKYRKPDKDKGLDIRSEVSRIYNEIIAKQNNIATVSKRKIVLDNIFNNPLDINQFKSIPYTDNNFRNSYNKLLKEIDNLSVEITKQLKSKNGRIRKTTISKRVDFTGGAVIIPAPELRIDTIGIPIRLLLEWLDKELIKDDQWAKLTHIAFQKKPGLVTPLEIENYILNDTEMLDAAIKEAKKISLKNLSIETEVVINRKDSKESNVTKSVIVEEMIKVIYKHLDRKRILSIRFPSLHRQNEMGYKMVISYSSNIKLHPLVCEHYNADFDGDNESTYLIETEEAVEEVDELLMPSRNMTSAQGQMMLVPKQDAVMGFFWLTTPNPDLDTIDPEKYEIPYYNSYSELFNDYKSGVRKQTDIVMLEVPHYTESYYEENFLRDRLIYADNLIRMRRGYASVSENKLELIEYERNYPTKPIIGTVGQFIINSLIPQDLGFVDRTKDEYGLEVTKQTNSKLIKNIMQRVLDKKQTLEVKYVADLMKEQGYAYGVKAGVSMGLLDLISIDKTKDLEEGVQFAKEQKERLENKEITEEEYKKIVIDKWQGITSRVNQRAVDSLSKDNAMYLMQVSGSRGSTEQLVQMIGMRGPMKDTTGEILPTPVTASLSEGVTPEEFFTGAFASRSGMYDRSNRTKVTGAASRTDGFGVEDIIITTGDCGDTEGIILRPLEIEDDPNIKPLDLYSRANNRFTLEPITDPETGEILININELIPANDNKIKEIINAKESIKVRSQHSCKALTGICSRCYGYSIIDNRYARVGMASGIIASQTINERSSQLTMRTFHTGGSALAIDIGKAVDIMRQIRQTATFSEGILDINKEALDVYDTSRKELTDKLIEVVRERFSNFINKYDIQTIEDYIYPKGPREVTYEDLCIIKSKTMMELRDKIRDELHGTYHMFEVSVHDIYFESYSRAMGGMFQVVDPGDANKTLSEVVTFEELIRTNINLVNRGLKPMVVIHQLMNIKELAVCNHKPLTSLAFQDISKNNAIVTALGLEDRLINPKGALMVANNIPTGRDGIKAVEREILEDERPILSKSEWLTKNIEPKVAEFNIEPKQDEPTTEEQTPQITEPVTESITVEIPNIDKVVFATPKPETSEQPIPEQQEELSPEIPSYISKTSWTISDQINIDIDLGEEDEKHKKLVNGDKSDELDITTKKAEW